MNSNWPLWIAASINKHFDAICSASSLPLFIEGEDRQTNTLADWAELRLNGPVGHQLDARTWDFTVDLNFAVSSARNDRDLYAIHRDVGIVAAGFTPSIKVYQLDGSDPAPVLECLQILGDVIITHFGQIKPDVSLMQASVEGRYHIILR